MAIEGKQVFGPFCFCYLISPQCTYAFPKLNPGTHPTDWRQVCNDWGLNNCNTVAISLQNFYSDINVLSIGYFSLLTSSISLSGHNEIPVQTFTSSWTCTKSDFASGLPCITRGCVYLLFDVLGFNCLGSSSQPWFLFYVKKTCLFIGLFLWTLTSIGYLIQFFVWHLGFFFCLFWFWAIACVWFLLCSACRNKLVCFSHSTFGSILVELWQCHMLEWTKTTGDATFKNTVKN